MRAARVAKFVSRLPASAGMSSLIVSLIKPDHCTRAGSTVTGGKAVRLPSTSASAIASVKRCAVAEMPQTTGIGRPVCSPLTRLRTIVDLSRDVFVLKPRWASSRIKYTVSVSSSIVFKRVCQMLYARSSGVMNEPWPA